jgi:uncharacterized protein (AIM24 family)
MTMPTLHITEIALADGDALTHRDGRLVLVADTPQTDAALAREVEWVDGQGWRAVEGPG